MINLASTSDILRIVTASAVATIGVQASWVDNSGSTYTPGRTNTAITTATTTTIVASPGASTQRNVKGLSIENNNAASSNIVTVQHFDGTVSVDLIKVTLLAGENLQLGDDGTWRHFSASGAEYRWGGPTPVNLGITGTIAETMPRQVCPEDNSPPLTSGTLHAAAIYLRAGQVVTNISFFSATTAAGVPTNQFFAIYNSAGGFLARSADDTTTAWAANTIKTLALTAAYTVQKSGFYYVAILVVATTVPTLKGLVRTGATLPAIAMPLNGNTSTGLTSTLPTQMSPLPSGSVNQVWAAIT